MRHEVGYRMPGTQLKNCHDVDSISPTDESDSTEHDDCGARGAAGTSADRDTAEALDVVLFVRNIVLRVGVGSMLRQLPISGRIHECDQGDQVRNLLERSDIDVVIVTTAEDEVVRDYVCADSEVKVLLLLDELEVANAEAVHDLYADGIQVQQELSPSTLDNALRQIISGEMSMPPGLGRRLLSRNVPSPSGWPRPAALTSRESETLLLLAEGLSNKELARRLSISDHGAKRLVTSIMLKLGVPNRTAAVVAGIRSGLIALERLAPGDGAR